METRGIVRYVWSTFKEDEKWVDLVYEGVSGFSSGFAKYFSKNNQVIF